jgi:hypothetical protein
LFTGSLLWGYIKTRISKEGLPFNRTILLALTFSLVNFCFSVLTSMNVLRYQFFPLIICLAFALLQMEWVDKIQIQQINLYKQPKKTKLRLEFR